MGGYAKSIGQQCNWFLTKYSLSMYFAKFEIRRLDPAARKILGTAIGVCSKEVLYKKYMELVLGPPTLFPNLTLTYSQLREFNRPREDVVSEIH
jgi:hypothetical protein